MINSWENLFSAEFFLTDLRFYVFYEIFVVTSDKETADRVGCDVIIVMQQGGLLGEDGKWGSWLLTIV